MKIKDVETRVGITFREVLSHRLESLGDEERNLESVKRICEDLLQSNLPYSAVTEKVLEEDAGTWDRQLKRIIAVSLLWGNWLLDSSGLVPILLGIVCYAAIYFTADVRILLVLFHITDLNLVPETAFVFMAAPTLIASSREKLLRCCCQNRTHYLTIW